MYFGCDKITLNYETFINVYLTFSKPGIFQSKPD